MTYRRLDGSAAGNMKAVVSRYRAKMGTRRVKRGKGKGKETQGESGASTERMSERTDGGCTCDIPHGESACAFVFEERFKDIIQSHHVIFRFRAGCKEPRNVDGKFAWTTKETHIRKCEMRLMFKSKDNPTVKHEYVPLSSLEPCAPLLKEDEALVIRGDDAWKVVYPSHKARDIANNDTRGGMYCKMNEKDKKKDSKAFELKAITRIRQLEKGYPVT